MNILITGGNGFVGRHISKYLSATCNVFVPNRNELDLNNSEQVDIWFKNNKIDNVIHCALSGREQLFSKDPKFLSDGLLMFRNLWNNKHNFKKLINLGTAYEFDLSTSNNFIKEEDFINFLPLTSYGYAKNIISRIIQTTDNFYNLRLFGVFHETEASHRFFQSLKLNSKITISEDRFLDYIYLEDIFPVIDKILIGECLYTDINMVYDIKFKLSELAKILCDIRKIDTNNVMILNSDGLNLTGDSSKINSLQINLIGLEKGLARYR